MKLYFSPLACSLSSRIACYEAGADVTFVHVDSKSKQTDDGRDFRTINSLGLVPSLEIEPGDLLTENSAILQYIAARFPDAKLSPTDVRGRARLQQLLSFIGTELHKALYVPLLDKNAPEAVREYALRKMESRLGWLDQQLKGREFLLDGFTVADAYLFAVLNWSMVTPVELAPYPAIQNFYANLQKRPSVARAFAEERALYMKELSHGVPASAAAAAS
jgi:glutathione S-transferase